MKTVLITGASSGFGAMMTLKFAREGFYVYATARDLSKEEVKRISDVSTKEGLEVEWIKLDVTSQEDVDRAVKRVVDMGSGLDILINNAGYGLLGPVESFNLEQIKNQFDTNFFGVVRLTHAFLPMMREKGSGRIINMSSIAGLLAVPMYGIYSSSKHALEAMSESLRNEVKPFGIEICLVEPGSFDTSFGKNVKGGELSKDSPYYRPYKALKKRRSELDSQLFFFKFSSIFRNPEMVVDAVYRLSEKSNPPLRTLVGLDAKLEYIVRKILPSSWWDTIVGNSISRVVKRD